MRKLPEKYYSLVLMAAEQMPWNWQLDGVSLIPNCTTTILEEIDKAPKGLIKITDILGRTIKATNNNLLFYIYDNGSVEKIYSIE